MVNEANPNAYKQNPRVRTWGGSADRPVVAVAPKPYAPSGGMNTQQNVRAADAYASSIPFVSGAKQAADAEAEATRIANEVLGGQSYGGTGTRTTPFQNAMAMLSGGGSGGGTGGGGGVTAKDRLARDEFNYQKEQDAASAQARQRTLQGMIDQITSNSYRGNIDDLIAQIEGMNTTGQKNIGDIYNTAIGNIGAGYDAAQGLVDTGYGALQTYLQQNQNNPYAGLSVENMAVANPMQDYLNAYGAMSPDVAGQVQAEQFAGQQGAGAFQNLINILGANAKSNDLSRLAESQMAQKMATSGLGAQKAAYTSQASTAQQQALASLAQQIAQAKFEQEQAAGGRKQSIIDAIIAAGGSIPQSQSPANTVQNLPAFEGLNQDVLAQLAARRTGF
jgi:hypothetical protein